MQINAFDYLVGTAAKYPDAPAFMDEKVCLSFGDLLHGAEAVGTSLQVLIKDINLPVAVLTRRDTTSLIGFMGVLSCGCFYTPIDCGMPRERLEDVLTQLAPAALLYGEEDADLAKSLYSDSFPLLCINDAVNTAPEADRLFRARMSVIDADPVYVLFTSGSTGKPKGIVISHRAIIDFTDWYAGLTCITEKDRLGNQAPFFFDLSVKDIYLTLKTGAATYILSKTCFMFPVLLVDALNKNKITTLSWSTSAFHMIANSGVFAKHPAVTLRRVLVGGEALHAKQLNIWRSAMPDVQYYNLYGPTEVTVDCTYYAIQKTFLDEETIPIGRACANMEVLLLDEYGFCVHEGDSGEICVRGSGLAIGYYGDKEKTESSFIIDPRFPAWQDRLYRTGDIGRLNEDGDIEFLSRKDDQVKHLGYRIELGEIETALNSIKGIDAAVCLFDGSRDRIICVYQGPEAQNELIRQLRKKIPKYMLPNEYHSVHALPLTRGGKVDRAAIKEEYLCSKK